MRTGVLLSLGFLLICLAGAYAALTRLQQLPGYDLCDHQNRICDYSISVSPQRVRPDGFAKIAYLVNGTLPGPTLYSFEGYRFVVRVRNELEDLGITIHFHGQIQYGTPFYDGVAYVSQCPIAPGSVFVHEWWTEPSGTGWYHSHSGLQYPEGVFGPMIVYETDTKTNPYWGMYDGEIVYLINDWYPLYNQFQRLIEFQNNGFEGGATSDIRYQSILINGRGRCQPLPYFPELQCQDGCVINTTDNYYRETCQPCTPENHPLDWKTVEKGKTYRLRLINGGSSLGWRFSIDNHRLRVIAQSQGYVQEQEVDSIVALPGERFDVLLTADQPVANYYIRVEVPSGQGQLAVLHYTGANDAEPPLNLLPPQTQNSRLISYYQEFGIASNQDCCAEGIWPQIRDCCNATMGEFQPARFKGLRISGGLVPQKAFQAFNFSILGTMKPDYYITINNIINVNPRVPYMFSKGLFGLPEEREYRTVGPLREFNLTWFIKAHLVTLEYRRVYDVIWLNKGPMLHPLHMHGHRFWLIGFGPKNFVKVGPQYNFTNNFASFGESPGDYDLLNFVDPPFVDTAVVPAKGWLYLRFIADNPGPWFYHCHIETHVAAGMGVVWLEAPDRWPELPDDMMRCGSSPVISPVRNVKAKLLSNRRIRLTWDKPVKGDVNNYEIQYRPFKGCNIPFEDSVTTEVTEITVQTRKSVEYEFNIRARNFMNGESPVIVVRITSDGKTVEVHNQEVISRSPRPSSRKRTFSGKKHPVVEAVRDLVETNK